MRLIFIYGPPGVGKLTVGRELARLTGFRLFHNHVSIDCVQTVFDFGTPSFYRLVDLVRVSMLEEAARAALPGLIFTFVYAKGTDDPAVERMAGAVERHGGEVCFVRLHCERAALDARVVVATRREQSKVSSLELLNDIAARHDIFSPITNRDSLTIDNTHLSPHEAAALIAAHCSSG